MDDHKLDLDQIRAVVQIASEADIAELEVESPTLKISVKKAHGRSGRGGADPPGSSGVAEPVETAPPTASGPRTAENHLVPISAPMVGTFYRASSPEAPPLIDEGDFIRLGQTVCIIEAMKLFNEIQSEIQGRVVKVLVDNAAPVEYGQPLFLVDPTATQTSS